MRKLGQKKGVKEKVIPQKTKAVRVKTSLGDEERQRPVVSSAVSELSGFSQSVGCLC